MKKKSTVEAYKPKIPYPQALIHDQSKNKMMMFIDIFKKFKINLHICDFLLQVPKSI